MKMKRRKDKPYKPVISSGECGAGLQLVEEILNRIIERGDIPEQVVARAVEFTSFLHGLRRVLKTKAKDDALFHAAILANTLPTLAFGHPARIFSSRRAPNLRRSTLGSSRQG